MFIIKMNNCTTDPIESTTALPNLPLETREQILLYLDFNKLEEIRKFDKCVKQSKISTARVNNTTKFGDMRIAIKNSKDNKYILENIKWIESKSMTDLNKSHECGNMMNHALMSNNVEIIQYFKNRNYPINSYIYILHKYYPIVDQGAYGNVKKQWILDRSIACNFAPTGQSATEDVKPNVNITKENILLGRI